MPPAPWANVIANPRGGFVVTERGAGFTWAENSYFYRLTPWHNDPVSDPSSDVLYLRDEETGELWSADAGAGRERRRRTPCGTAPGSSTFEHARAASTTELTLGMARRTQPVKLIAPARHESQRPRRAASAVTAYVEWTLGVLREQTQHQRAYVDSTPSTGALARAQYVRSAVRDLRGVLLR